MQKTWETLDACLSKVAKQNPDFEYELNSGATDAEIATLQAALPYELPKDYIACLKIHNGEATGIGVFDSEEFLSTEDVLFQYNIWKTLLDDGTFEDEDGAYTCEPDVGTREDWWHTGLIPFTHNGGGDHLCLDLNPTQEGHYGQIVRTWHDDLPRTIVASDFATWFGDYVAAVAAGDYVYDDDYGTLIHVDELEEA